MDWWRLTLSLTAMVMCGTLVSAARTELHSILDGHALVELSWGKNGPPTAQCYYRYQSQRVSRSQVVDLPRLKERGYRLLVDLREHSVTCRVVPVTEELQISDITCPNGWTLLQETCFYATPTMGSWEECRSVCRNTGGTRGTLAIISSDKQQVELSRVVVTVDTWIGLRVQDDNETYAWTDGSTSTYRSWGLDNVTSLDTPDQKGCVEMQNAYNFQWNDTDCEERKSCLCSVPGTAHIATTTVPPSVDNTLQCPSDWLRRQSSCYGIFKTPLSYWEAKVVCKQHHAHLVSIHSEEENSFIRSHIKGKSYIGLTDKEREGIFKWNDGSTLKFTRWSRGNPDDYGHGESCVELRPSDSRWNDIHCGLKKHFVCKKSADKANPTQQTRNPYDDYMYYDSLLRGYGW